MIKKGDRYVILSFDTESDIGSWTQNYESIDKAMPEILKLLKSKNTKATFLWEGMAALHNPDMLKKTFDEGHECACHSLQHESVGKPSYFIPGDRPILKEEVSLRLSKNEEIVRDITGEKPVSFRAPRLWGDKEVLNELEKRGFLVDSTYAVSSEHDNIFPYHPDSEDISKTGDMNILEIPVSGLYGDMLSRTEEKIKDFGREVTQSGKTVPQWPVMRLYGGKSYSSYFEPFIQEQMNRKGYSVVCTYHHPWEFIEMPGIIECPEGKTYLNRTLYENCGNFSLSALSDFIDDFKAKGFKFVTLERMRRIWEE